jgi:flavorubredoxin
MAEVSEIAPDVFRLSAYNAQADFQFNSFLVRDDEPLLYHTNLRGFFGEIREAAATVLDPATIRWIGFSHFESDECGALNDWLAIAPNAEPVCSFVGARTSVADFSDRLPKVLGTDERIETGRHRFRLIETKHLPHCWDASMLYDEAGGTLFCSDLFGHGGTVEPLIEGDIIARTEAYTLRQQEGPMAQSVPFTRETRPILDGLAALSPRTLACMHGSSYAGDGASALRTLGETLERIYGGA